MSDRRWAAGLFLISAALLGFELLLMRLLALAYWGHFAGFVISIAMLGLAASGLLLHFRRDDVRRRPTFYFAVGAIVFAIGAPLAFLLSQKLPFTPFLLAWSPREYGILGARVLLFFLPFFCGGIAIGVPFVARIAPPARVYLWNMGGSAAAFLPLLAGFHEAHAVRLLAPATLIAFAAACSVLRGKARLFVGVTGVIVGLLAWFTPFHYSQFKDLSKTLLLPETKVIAERFAPGGVVQTVESPHTRYLPGLSLNFAGVLPPSRLVFTDGSAMEVVFNAEAVLREADFLMMSPEAFSYKLRSRPRALLLYSGPVDVLRSLAAQASGVVWVDDLAERIEAINAIWKAFGRSPLQGAFGAPAAAVNDEALHFLATSGENFELISLSLLGSHGSSTAGAASLDPAPLLTVEGFSRLFDRLTPQGHAAISAWVENPPNSGVRLASLIIATLRQKDVREPARHLLALRGWSTITFFMLRQPATEGQIAALKQFAESNSFDLVAYPGITAAEANRVNVIPDAPYFTAVQGLLEGPEAFRERAPFQTSAPTRQAPFFHHYFKWEAVPQFMSRMGRDWVPFVEWGYLLHLAAFLVAGLAGVLLLIIPAVATRASPTWHTGLLFFLLGVAYMLVEIWALYSMFHFLSQPAVASAIILTGMLAASGAGAVVLVRRSPRTVLFALLTTVALTLLLLPLLHAYVFPAGIAVRAICAVIWIALPAFFMGFPFPYSLGRLAGEHEIPWALALNGFGSVIGSLGATLLAVHLGLRGLALCGLALYAAVALLVLRRGRENLGD